jgi:pre-mRNA-splicing factor CWC22
MLGTRTGGAYIPPARLRAMQAEAAKDKTSAEYQRLSWDALRKSINGMINKVRCSLYENSGLKLMDRSMCRISNTSYPSYLART